MLWQSNGGEISLELNNIYNIDCLEGFKDIPDGSIDLIVTDPPYLINYKSNYRKDRNHDSYKPIPGDDDKELVKSVIKQCFRVLKNDSAMYMFCNCDNVDFFKQELEKYFNIKNMIIWVKNNWTGGDLKARFGKQYEIIFLVNKGRKYFNGKRITDVWNFNYVHYSHQVHRNQKPVDLLKQCIEKHSDVGETVLDPFSGGGLLPLLVWKQGETILALRYPRSISIKRTRESKNI